MLGKLNSYFERQIGTAALSLSRRSQVLTEQAETILQTLPGLSVGTLFIVSVVLFHAWNGELFLELASWSACMLALQWLGFRPWLRRRDVRKREGNYYKTLRKTVIQSFMAGTCWGMLPVIVLPSGNPDLTMLIAISMSAVLFGATFGLTSIPQAVFAFLIPCLAGISTGLVTSNGLAESAALFAMVLSFVALIPPLSVRYARNLVRHIVAEMELWEQKQIISLVVQEFEENSSDWLWEFDANGRVSRVTARFASAWEMDPEELAGADFVALLKEHASEEEAVWPIESALQQRDQFRDVEVAVTIKGETRWWNLTGKPNLNSDGGFQGYVGICSDISKRKSAEIQINRLAHRDVLTGLLNRAMFNEKMDAAIAKLERYGSQFGVLFLDLDKFKLINDPRGHQAGDQLLKAVGKRIASLLREGDHLARLGGDEFAIIMHNQCDAGAAAKLAARLIAAIKEPFEIDGERHRIGVSIGIALAPQNGTRPAQLLRNADLALYRAKADGRCVFRFFETQMDADEREKRMLEAELRSAIDNQEFELVYQPLVSPDTGKATSMEALIRWNHPIRGLVPPFEFIPIAEQSALIQEIGKWSIMQACQSAMSWPNEVVVAVNLSVHHFMGSDIVGHVKEALEATGLDPHRLELEITESLLINNTDEALSTLKALKDLGVTIALDDFGTGYSSLSYILKFPFDKIKIDRSFVTGIASDEAARAILRMISTLGESLNIGIIAEGVETAEQVTFLRSINCHQFQGYFFAKPINQPNLAEYFEKEVSLMPADTDQESPKQATRAA